MRAGDGRFDSGGLARGSIARWADALLSVRVWLAGGLMSLASPPTTGFLRLLALLRLQPGERARFPCGEIPADVPDGRSVPVIRSGNTGESRFLGASLAVAVPIPFQDSGCAVPNRGAWLQFRSNRGRHRRSQGWRSQRTGADERCSRGDTSARAGTVRRLPSALPP